ncbi:MAG: hypothetical protein DMF82_23545 [Acidobacteria bacterium]|nr:MAG: hypothetical protein DMF82_23545 [Acidobacteriota bacterium]
MCAWSVTMKTRSPATATPRLVPPAASPARPFVRVRRYDQMRRPLPASSAWHSFAVVTYMIPSTTTGVTASRDAFGIA